MSRPCADCKYKSYNPWLRDDLCHSPEVKVHHVIDGYRAPECVTVRNKNRSYVGGEEGFVYGECQHFKPTLIVRLIDLLS